MTRISGRRLLMLTSTVVCLACGSDKVIPPPSGAFNGQIEVRYASDITPEVQSAVTLAVAKWARALSKNMGDFPLNSAANHCFVGEPQLSETHHNLLLFVSLFEIDGHNGQLAYTQICSLSDRDTLPILSHIRLDRADLDSMVARGVLDDVLMHEMGHALGFVPTSYMPKALAIGGTDDPTFVGTVAQSEFAKHGAWYVGARVPLENSAGSGPRDPHWRFTVFGDELMVPVVGPGFKSPLSSITLGLFRDLGYTVDFSQADPYEVVPLFGDNRVVPESSLRNDVVRTMTPTFVSPVATY
jgi:hypothetical protein